jgi:hypothetical protein
MSSSIQQETSIIPGGAPPERSIRASDDVTPIQAFEPTGQDSTAPTDTAITTAVVSGAEYTVDASAAAA